MRGLPAEFGVLLLNALQKMQVTLSLGDEKIGRKVVCRFGQDGPRSTINGWALKE